MLAYVVACLTEGKPKTRSAHVVRPVSCWVIDQPICFLLKINMAVGKTKTVRRWRPRWRRLKSENEVGLKEVPDMPVKVFATWYEEELGMPSIRKDIRPAGRFARNVPGSRSCWSPQSVDPSNV